MLLALWVAAAVGALLLGLSAVGSIGSGLTGGTSSPPLSAQEIEARLAVAPPAAPRPPASPRQGTAVVLPAGPAGTVLARCVNGTPSVVSVNPAQGYEAGEDDGGGTVKLESDDADVSVALRCAATGPGPAGTVTVDQDD